MTPEGFRGICLFSLDDFKGSRLAVNLPRQLRARYAGRHGANLHPPGGIRSSGEVPQMLTRAIHNAARCALGMPPRFSA